MIQDLTKDRERKTVKTMIAGLHKINQAGLHVVGHPAIDLDRADAADNLPSVVDSSHPGTYIATISSIPAVVEMEF